MKYDEYKELSDEEQKAYFEALDEKGVLYDDMEAERDSFQKENEKIKKELLDVKAEMKKTKEMNFTLARQFKSEPEKSAEDILHDMFK